MLLLSSVTSIPASCYINGLLIVQSLLVPDGTACILLCMQAKAARQERIKALSKMPGIPDGEESREVNRAYRTGRGQGEYLWWGLQGAQQGRSDGVESRTVAGPAVVGTPQGPAGHSCWLTLIRLRASDCRSRRATQRHAGLCKPARCMPGVGR
jgi:hypothetical protein